MFGHDDTKDKKDAADNELKAETLENPAAPPSEPPVTVPSQDSVALPTPRASADNAGGDNLLDIKQSALKQLSPLVGHLNQTPEEKFRTTMMLIQASDNQDLIKDAYEAAQAITDDKTKAQALLDVINEINYFSQQKDS